MLHELVDIFRAVLHEDNVARKKAERELAELKERHGVCEALCSLAVEQSIEQPVRQLTIITLKNWISGGTWAYDREMVHSCLLHVLCDSSAGDLALRTCGVAIAKTALVDFPDHWPTLLSDLVSLFSTEHAKYAILCVCCLTEELVGSSLESLAFFVHHLLVAADGADLQRAALILKAVDALCLTVGVSHPEIKEALSSAFPMLKDQALTNVNEENLGVVLHSLHIIQKIFKEFPTLWDAATMMRLTELLSDEQAAFEEYVINESDDEEISVGVSKVAARRLDLLLTTVRHKKLARFCKDCFSEHGFALSELLLRYAMMTFANESAWMTDVNCFHKHEEDRKDAISWAPRDIAADCAQALTMRLGDAFVTPFLEKCQSVLQETVTPENWKMREAVLFTLSHVALCRMSEFVRCGAHLSFPGLIQMLLDSDLGIEGMPPLLACRAILLVDVLLEKGGKAACDPPAFDDDTLLSVAQSLLPACISAISASDILISSCSCTLVLTLVRRVVPPSVLAEHHTAALHALVTMMQRSGVFGETLYAALDVLHQWLKRSPVVDDSNRAVPQEMMDLWGAHMQDPNVGDYVQSTFEVILRRAAQYEDVLVEMLPSMSSILQGHASMTALCCIPHLLAIIRGMVKCGSIELIEALRQNVLGLMCQLVLTNEDTGIAEEALRVLASLLKRVRGDILDATVEVVPSALAAADDALPMLDEMPEPTALTDVLLAIANLILSDARNEKFLFSAGGFLREVARVLPPCLSQDEMAGYVCALASRAVTVRTDAALQELMLPMASLICSHAVAVLDVLLHAAAPSSQQQQRQASAVGQGSFDTARVPVAAHSAQQSVSDGPLLLAFLEKWIVHESFFSGPQIAVQTGRALLTLLESCPHETRTSIMIMLPTSGAAGEKRHRSRRVPVTLEVALFVGAGKALVLVMSERRNIDEFGDSDSDLDGDCEVLDTGRGAEGKLFQESDAAATTGDEGEGDDEDGDDDVDDELYGSSSDDEDGGAASNSPTRAKDRARSSTGDVEKSAGELAVDEFVRLLPFVDALASCSLEFFTERETQKLQKFVASHSHM